MKISGRNITRRLYGLTTLPGRVARARYFRGHGVHSPFVYAIVRQVFMKSALYAGPHPLYDALQTAEVPRRRAVQLQNLLTHCGYRSFAVDDLPEACDLCIITPRSDEERTRQWIDRAARQHTSVAVMSPYENRRRREMCGELIRSHAGTTVDNRGYLLLFNDDNLPKQHFRI